MFAIGVRTHGTGVLICFNVCLNSKENEALRYRTAAPRSDDRLADCSGHQWSGPLPALAAHLDLVRPTPQNTMKACPNCGRKLRNEADECKYCHEFDPKQFIRNTVPTGNQSAPQLRPQMRNFLGGKGFTKVKASWKEEKWEVEMTVTPALQNEQVEHILDRMAKHLRYKTRRCDAHYQIDGEIRIVRLPGRLIAIFALSPRAISREAQSVGLGLERGE
jgi:hypothetical protein